MTHPATSRTRIRLRTLVLTLTTDFMSSPHKPRRKHKKHASGGGGSGAAVAHGASSALVVRQPDGAAPAFPLVAFLWPARRGTSQWVLLPLILLVAGLFRWAVGLWGYSGAHPTLD